MEKLYERADIYDLIETEDRSHIVRNDWKALLAGRKIETLLDVSIGAGAMTLPLQELGVSLCGSDLSGSMLEKCCEKAAAKRKPLELKCCDFRDLSAWGDRQFDCVTSTGNSLAYVSNEDVVHTLAQMDAHVKPGGYLCLDSRNWEKIQREKQRFYFYNPFFRDGTRINLMQVWDHNPDGSITFNLVYTFERDNKIVQKEIFEEHYNPFPLELVTSKLQKMGYSSPEMKPVPCFLPETDFSKIDWYRIIAQKQ